MNMHRVIKVVREVVKDKTVEISPQSKLREDLGIKSIDIVALIGRLEDEYDVEIEMSHISPQVFQTVDSLSTMVHSIIGSLT